MHSSKKGNIGSPSVIFDIGSASVGAALVLTSNKNDSPVIIYETRAPITYKDTKNQERLLLSMLSALKNVIVNIEQDGMHRLLNDQLKMKDVENIFCVFSSPWYISNIEKLKFKKDDSFTISAKIISDMLADADERFLELLKTRQKNKINDPKIVEKNIIQVLLNGYITDKPYGKKANNINITLFMSAISTDVLKNTKSVLERSFDIDKISFHTFALSSFSVVRDIFKAEKNFLLIDISGKTTDIILTRDETMIKENSFPLGKNFLIKKIGESLSTPLEEAHSLIRMHIEGKSAGRESAKIEKALLEAREKWLSSFRKILLNFSDGLSLPNKIFLTVDTDIGKWFIDTIKSDEFSMYTLAQQPFTVIELSSRILNEYCSISEGKTTRCDPFLAIEAIFVNKIANV